MLATDSLVSSSERPRGKGLFARRRKRWRARLQADRQALKRWRCLAKLAQRSVARLEARIARLERWLAHLA